MPARNDLDARVMAAALARRMFGDEHRTPIRIGRFLVLDRIGGGGMGTVFRAYDPELDRSVAVKVLRPDIARDDPSSARRMQREAMGLARLSHPNVVTIHEVGTSEGRTFLAMELVQGDDLAQWMRTHPVGGEVRFAAAMELLQQAGRGLAAAHSAGLVHRDFKPSNVLIGDAVDGGRARVADFGLVRSASDVDTASESDLMLATGRESGSSQSRVTQAGALVGTLRYMSPEQQQGRGVDARSDQFSFCVTAWELLFGCLPWPDGASDEPPEVPDNAPRWVVAVLARGLQFQPGARYPDMPQLLVALSRDPRRRRRLWALGIGTASALVAGAATFAHHRATMCDDGPAALAQTWNDERRSSLAQHFAALGVPAASDTWARADAHLQSLANEWISTWNDVCDAGRRRHTIAQETFHSASACLDVGRVDLDATLFVLENGDASTAAHAAELAYALRPPTACRDSRGVVDSVPLPTDPDRATEALELARASTRARAASIAGDPEEALAELDAIAPSLAELDHSPLTLRSEQVRAAALNSLRRRDEAAAIAEAAYWTALRTGDDAMASAFALTLLYDAVSRNDPAKGEGWLAYTRVYGERANLGDARWARIEEGNARLLVVQGDLEGARARLDEALVLSDSAWGPSHPQSITIYDSMAIVHRLSHEFDDAARLSRESIAIQEASYGPDSLAATAAMANLAASLSSMGRPDEALEIGKRLLAIRSAWLGDHPDVAQSLTDLAATAGSAGRAKEAAEMLRSAAAMFERHVTAGDDRHLLAKHNLAQLLFTLGERDEAAEIARATADGYVAAVGDDHPRVAMARWGLGRILIGRREYAEAREQLELAQTIYEHTWGPKHPETLSVRLERARADFAAGDPDAAGTKLTALVPDLDSPAVAVLRGEALTLQGQVLDQLGRRDLR